MAASITGFTAKEAIVSTMGVLANVAGDTENAANVASDVAAWFPSATAAFSFLLFNLLDSPFWRRFPPWHSRCSPENGSGLHRVPEHIRLCSFIDRVSDRYICNGWKIYSGNCCRISASVCTSGAAVRPDLYKNQKVYFKRLVQAA